MEDAVHYLRADEAEVQTLIREAGFIPARRDTLYKIQEVFDTESQIEIEV